MQQLTWEVFHTSLWCISRKECQEYWHTQQNNKLPTTQTVVNSIIQSKMGKDPNGTCQLFMDNCYDCASFFVLLREKFDILCAGTTRANRVGWPKDKIKMSKPLFLAEREFDILCAWTTRTNREGWPKDKMTETKSAAQWTMIRVYNQLNQILCIHWMDNKVVSLTSSLNISGDTPVNRRGGSNVLALTVD